MKGKLIVFEGGDGSGKATQTELLCRHLREDGKNVRSVTFPNYKSLASAPVQMYLAGEFGTRPDDVSPYAASTLYAVDRYVSFRAGWRKFYENDGIIIADRYTTSNMVHQMVKYCDPVERQNFLTWLVDFEYEKLNLPRPDKVFLLDVPIEVTATLMQARVAKTGGATGDIHERDLEYLRSCHAAYDELEEKYGWVRIACTKAGKICSAEEIHAKIYKKIKKLVL